MLDKLKKRDKGCQQMTEPAIEGLDEGIRHYVLTLMSEGVETFESCEGGEGHCMPEPTVRFHGEQHEGYRAFSVALMYGLPVFSLRRYYSVTDNQLEGPWWEMTFRTKAKTD